jgi:hypothetical protein
VARLQLSERELHVLRTSLHAAVDGACIPGWEFEALIGCTRSRARRSLDAGLRRIELRGERPAEPVCERMVLLLSAALGARQALAADELRPLIAKLTAQERSPLESGIALRGDVVVPKRARSR